MTVVYPQHRDEAEVAIDCSAPFAVAVMSVGCNQMDMDDYCILQKRDDDDDREKEMNVSDCAQERDEQEGTAGFSP
jgi:hypothetical protein